MNWIRNSKEYKTNLKEFYTYFRILYHFGKKSEFSFFRRKKMLSSLQGTSSAQTIVGTIYIRTFEKTQVKETVGFLSKLILNVFRKTAAILSILNVKKKLMDIR